METRWPPALFGAIALLLVAASCMPGEATPPPQGVLNGTVSIGPLCPVEPCDRPPGDIYSSRALLLQQKGRQAFRIPLKAEGCFSAPVPAGTYSVELSDCDFLGCSHALPVTTTVRAGETVTLHISIDTGIRGPVSPPQTEGPKGPVPCEPGQTVEVSPDGQYLCLGQVPAPIDEVEVLIRESFPPQYAVRVVSGLPNSCIMFDRIEQEREGDRIEVSVFNLAPTGGRIACAQVYGTVENIVELGTDFQPGQTYTVAVNEVVTTFVAR